MPRLQTFLRGHPAAFDGRHSPARWVALGSAATITGSGPVAQSVEQRIENPCVGGSIPPQATRIETPLVYSSGIAAFWGAHALKA